jgi:hypothetical protein
MVTYHITSLEYEEQLKKPIAHFINSSLDEMLQVSGRTDISQAKTLPSIATTFEAITAHNSKLHEFNAWVTTSAEFINCLNLKELGPDIEIKEHLKFQNCGIISLNHILPDTELHHCKKFKGFSPRTQFTGDLSLIGNPAIKGIHQPIPGRLTIINCKSFEFLGKDFKCDALETDEENAPLFIQAFSRINDFESQKALLNLCTATDISKNFKLKELIQLNDKFPHIPNLIKALDFKKTLGTTRFKIVKEMKSLQFNLSNG